MRERGGDRVNQRRNHQTRARVTQVIVIAVIDALRIGVPATAGLHAAQIQIDARRVDVGNLRHESIVEDILRDPESGRAFYTAQLVLDAESHYALDERKLQPGMPLEAFIQTDARSPASFLLKPLADYFAYAMREE